MTMSKKKVSFTEYEKLALVELVTSYPVIELKKTDLANGELKRKAWKTVTDLYNFHRDVTVKRSEKQLRKCWTNYKQKYLHLWKDKMGQNANDSDAGSCFPLSSAEEIFDVSQLAEPCIKEEDSSDIVSLQLDAALMQSLSNRTDNSDPGRQILPSNMMKNGNSEESHVAIPNNSAANARETNENFRVRKENVIRKSRNAPRSKNNTGRSSRNTVNRVATDLQLKRRMHSLQIFKLREELKLSRIQHSICMKTKEEKLKLLQLQKQYYTKMINGQCLRQAELWR